MAEMWCCQRCGKALAEVDGEPGAQRLIFTSEMLPSLLRDAPGFVEVECPKCGWFQKWHRGRQAAERLDSAGDV